MRMNSKKFLVIGLIGLTVLVGCNTASETASNGAQAASLNQNQDKLEADNGKARVLEAAPEVSEKPEVVDPATEMKKAAETQIKTLASLIGKSSTEARKILGEPSSSKNLEDTDVLLVDYYRLDYLGEIAKVEVIYNDDKKQVNFVSFTILKADHIDTTKENLMTTLTDLYGEPSIERIVDKKGKRNLNWTDGTLIYDLKYFESNISLDIYEADE